MSTSLGKGSLSNMRHGIITAPILYAMEEFPQVQAFVDRWLYNPADVDLLLFTLTPGVVEGKETAREKIRIDVYAG
ncbi:hypothetical protein Vadar_031830 [Vaccinium darrowii]|uniref:Uncharacterized protein n=1 Tax=Vaccinium darrowii TaxID=229202 RepID=A0ACB7YT88_9ERIC|nr:hypothetical protein Vadar_031830 [Vaccinium darrowii]